MRITKVTTVEMDACVAWVCDRCGKRVEIKPTLYPRMPRDWHHLSIDQGWSECDPDSFEVCSPSCWIAIATRELKDGGLDATVDGLPRRLVEVLIACASPT